jgi:hypothetical protein
VVLFLDEVDRATMEVRQGLFELTDSRKINGWHLHPETLIVAAVNGGEHGSQYQVGEMDPAELDRWTVFDVEPSVEDWLQWASSKVDPVLWDFVNHNRAHLEHTDDYEPNKVYPSRRSWVRFARTVEPLSIFAEDGNRDLLLNLATGFVGFEAAVALRDFVQKYEYQVSVEDILDHGSFDKIEKWGINDHAAMVEKMQGASTFAESLTDAQVTNLATWFVSMPSEICMKLWSAIGDAEDETGTNAIRYPRQRAHGQDPAWVMIMGSPLKEGDLVVPSRVSPAFREKHGFGVITHVLTESLKNENVVIYEVKFVKSMRVFRFGYDAVRRYGQD